MKTKLAIIFIIVFSLASFGKVKLPKLISDGMILQRNTDVNIWGWADANENISVSFVGSTYNTIADNKGNWKVVLADLKPGGPYQMQINSITINNILVGDVWVCSGQSNMELPMRRVSWNYPSEIEHSENKYIRQFLVPDKYNFDEPQNDLSSGTWKSASPENTPDFSATAYFFAKFLYEKYKVPIGLINSALGGSPVESWISGNALKKFPKYYNEAKLFRDSILIKKIEASDRARSNAWYTLLHKVDRGFKDPENIWYKTNLNTSDWSTMEVPGYWSEETDLGQLNGVIWFRKKVEIPSSMAGKSAKLILGRIVDADSAFINGQFVGTVSYQYPPRRYDIPTGLLKAGENTIVVRVISNIGKGGFVPDKQYAVVTKDTSINLTGEWKFHLGAEMPPLESQTFIRWKPTGLYNAMIAPLLNYKIKGVIWYQGESNAERPKEYLSLFSTMIKDWRTNWNEGNFPFLFVQLPNFMETKSEPSESNWALLREAQLKTLSLPNAGMVVAIDIGEWNDIHPLDKKDVGYRFALAAEKLAYGDNIVYSGPIYKSMKIDGNKIILSFTHTGSGLIAKGDNKLKYFAIAGNNKKFVWANAKIENNKVVVWNDKVKNPVAVRYAWADNPDGANLYNKEGLPASPFRTDDF
ncbi:beta galactosidase jelly roll domain-containing protein [bacterium BMS3Abin03]|nr:beta galactosidase jelly roll domain-containing protein [bacterium BMS3Abin03]